MSNPRDESDDLVVWCCDFFRGMLDEYAAHGQPPGAASREQLADSVAKFERELRETWGGQNVYLQRAGWNDRVERDASIRCDRAGGMSQREVARKHNVSRGMVRRVCGEPG